ncbi:N-6 DNA methylase [Methanobacterium formicicum]|uniref:N-6 DNA methylase n=1 Tax=Methanobacterium formicicum (strain DSM 3637 / PP1) TaxID=1204725 RepID=K2RER0_METFP|nr:N-6 DNA methylase [Methanobacterium formicicum]EKF86844.1 N-6 DNA methylase [Methanobacterium formicicum DSM 3637]
MSDDSISKFSEQIQRGIDTKLIEISDNKLNNTLKIKYNCSNKYETHYKNDSEEEVRAAFFVELILDYNYLKERIKIETKTSTRIPSYMADIVVYEDDKLSDPFLVVECKKDGISDAEFSQAIEQVFDNANRLNACYAVVVAGTKRRTFNYHDYKAIERIKNIVSDTPRDYREPPTYKYVRGGTEDIKSVPKGELIRILEKSHDTVWQGGKLAPTAAFDEISKLLFCKLKDEKDTIDGQAYKFQVGSGESYEDVSRRINSIYYKAQNAEPEVFADDIKLGSEVIYSIVEYIESLDLTETDLDSKGIAFEMFMEEFFRGKMGQFFTPREVINFCVDIIKPRPNELILDPACGSGGFLLYGMYHIRNYAKNNFKNEIKARDVWRDFAKNNIFGIELNDQIARVCKMNMFLHEDGHGHIISTDALQEFNKLQEFGKKFGPNQFDIILTNPPFGASVKKNEKPYLELYELGKKNRQKTEILFIERCIDFLKPGGRMAIVLPDGILTNSSQKDVRKYLMEKCQILAIVSLPQFAFSHFGAGVRSSLLFLRKYTDNETPRNYKIFMAIANTIGYDPTGKKVKENDLKKIIPEEYNKFLKEESDYNGLNKVEDKNG